VKIAKQTYQPVLILVIFFICFNFGIAKSHASKKNTPNDHTPDKHSYNKKDQGHIVVANRASGSLSIINVSTNKIAATIDLPSADNPSQPMYVVHSSRANRVFVGDRANNRIVVFDDKTFKYETSIPAGNGVFHMWADRHDDQLWVNNDIDNTATVIDPMTLEILATVKIPADLIELGGKPHDVILDPSGKSAYVTIVGLLGENDFVVKFDTENFKEIARAAVGKDAHLSLTRRNKLLYVPTQNSNSVYVFSRKKLKLKKIIRLPGAHGAGMTRKGKTFYTTNISGGGKAGLVAINTKTNAVIGQATDTPFPKPHNIALTRKADKLYITHSGATANQVSVYRIDKKSKKPTLETVVTVGLNPFGLTFVK